MERIKNKDEFIKGVNEGKTEFKTKNPKLKLELSAVESLQKILPYISKDRKIARQELDVVKQAEKHDFIFKMAIALCGLALVLGVLYFLKDKNLLIKTKGKLFGEMEIAITPAEPAPKKPRYKDVGNGVRLEYPEES